MNMNSTGTITHTAHTGMEAAGFAALWNPGLILVVVIIGWLYAMAVNRWQYRFADSNAITVGQQIYFFTGLFLYYIAEGSPLSYYSHHYSFSAHMFQQSILYMIIPPLILLGLPGWLLRPLFKHAAMKVLMRFFASPLISLFVFNMVFSFYHIPLIMDKLMTNGLLHGLYNAVFLLTAFQLWFQIFCPLPEYNRLSDLRKMGYIFVNGILLTPACALIIFAGQPIYASYAAVPEQFLFMSVINDQQLGGVIMKIIQEAVYGISLAYIFFRWYRRERKEEEEEDLQNESYIQPSVQTN